MKTPGSRLVPVLRRLRRTPMFTVATLITLAAGVGANAKLSGGWLVVRVTEAVPDARTVYAVADKGNARVWRRPDRCDHARAEWQSANNLLGAGFHAVQVECVRVQESEEEKRACAETREMPLPRFQTAHQA